MNKFINILLILLVIIIAFMVYFAYNTYYKPNHFDNLIDSSGKIVENMSSENQITSNNITPSEEVNNSLKNVIYEFTSADSFAAQGNPGILKIYELTNSQMDFEYNHGWNFEESTIDRKVSGIAKTNNENLYEFSENVDGHQYSIIIEFSEEMVTLSEYIDGELLSRINLWA